MNTSEHAIRAAVNNAEDGSTLLQITETYVAVLKDLAHQKTRAGASSQEWLAVSQNLLSRLQQLDAERDAILFKYRDTVHLQETEVSFPLYPSILKRHHRQAMGSAVWLYLWLLSMAKGADEMDSTSWSIVLMNQPITLAMAAYLYGVSEATAQRWIERLERGSYIRVSKTPKGMFFKVRNSNELPAARE